MNRPERLAGRVWCTKSQSSPLSKVEPGNSNSEGKRKSSSRYPSSSYQGCTVFTSISMGSSPRSNSFTSVACSRCSDSGVRREVREREQAVTSAAVRIPFHTTMKIPARGTFALLQKWRQNHTFLCVNRSLIIRYGLELSEMV